MAGGCRTIDNKGKLEERQCNNCFSRTACELEPRARELSALFSNQWVKREDLLPLASSPILYLTYSSTSSTEALHVGYYDGTRKCFVEQSNSAMIPEEQIIAWMAIPKVPTEIYDGQDYPVNGLSCFNTTPRNSEPGASL
jgi:hypothetical protein